MVGPADPSAVAPADAREHQARHRESGRRSTVPGESGKTVEPQVFDLLAYLIENRHRVVSKDDLLAAIWHGRIVSDSALTSRVNAARCALGDSGNEQRLIKTHLRKGIRFVGAVCEGSEVVA